LAGLRGERVNLFTEVQVLDEPEFIDYYAGVLGLRDTVRLGIEYTGTDRGSLKITSAFPWPYEERVASLTDFGIKAGKTEAEAAGSAQEYYKNFQQPMSEEEVQALA